MNIDRKKLSQEIIRTNALPKLQFIQANKHWWSREARITMLCSIMAHSKGLLHGYKRRLSWDKLSGLSAEEQKTLIEQGGHRLVEWTLAEQERYIGDNWKEFEWVEPAQQAG